MKDLFLILSDVFSGDGGAGTWARSQTFGFLEKYELKVCFAKKKKIETEIPNHWLHHFILEFLRCETTGLILR